MDTPRVWHGAHCSSAPTPTPPAELTDTSDHWLGPRPLPWVTDRHLTHQRCLSPPAANKLHKARLWLQHLEPSCPVEATSHMWLPSTWNDVSAEELILRFYLALIHSHGARGYHSESTEAQIPAHNRCPMNVYHMNKPIHHHITVGRMWVLESKDLYLKPGLRITSTWHLVLYITKRILLTKHIYVCLWVTEGIATWSHPRWDAIPLACQEIPKKMCGKDI